MILKKFFLIQKPTWKAYGKKILLNRFTLTKIFFIHTQNLRPECQRTWIWSG